MLNWTEKTLAILIPVYNEGEALEKHFTEMLHILEGDGIKARFLLIDDGSKDGTWSVIESLSVTHEGVSGLRFARNFGKEMALSAGLEAIDADLYVFMDSDLQHPPTYVKQMLDIMAAEGVDIVAGVKSSRGRESLKYKLIAKSFYKMLRRITQLDMDNSSDFKLVTREVVEAIRGFNERNVFFRGIVHWVGFKTVEMPFDVEERHEGTSNFSTFRLMGLASNAILSYTSRPLYLTIFSGMLFFLFAVILGGQTLYNYIVGYAVSGFSTVILLILITGSMLMLSIGIIGLYVSRIYDEVKQRPRYIVQSYSGELKKGRDGGNHHV